MFEFFEVEEEVPAPECGAFADGGGLSGLEVSKAEAGKAAVLGREPCELIDDLDEPCAEQAEAVAHEDEFGVIGDEAAGGAEVDDGACRGNEVTPGVDVGHDIVSEFSFVSFGGFEVDLIDSLAHQAELLGGDIESEFVLAFSEGDPEFAPGGVAVLGGPDAGHVAGGVACDKWVFVGVV